MKLTRATIDARRAICAGCPHIRKGPIRVADFCALCGCNIAGKTMLHGASCPAGKWNKGETT